MTHLLPGDRLHVESTGSVTEPQPGPARVRLADVAVPGGALSGVALAAADLLLGASCHSCGEPGLGVCADCRASLDDRTAFPVEGRVLGDREVTASSSYDPILRQLISAHKDRQAWQLTGVLGDRLGLAVQHLLAELDPERTRRLQRAGGRLALVPVPSAAAAVRRRGRDATAALARRAAGRLDLDCSVVAGLRPLRRIADQSGLDARARQHNLAGAFGVRPRRVRPMLSDGVPVVLVDDLTTTGATLREATRALTTAGVDVLGAAVVAAALRNHPGRDA